MSNDNLDVLIQTTDNTTMSLEQSKEFNNTKRKINGICKALSMNTQKYDPQKTVGNITSYITSTNKLDRILYSEISNYVYSLEIPQRGVFATNLEKLLLYSLDDNNSVNEDCKKMIVKIYDHFQLASHQIENVNNIFADGIEEAKENLQKQIKDVEKEYISILGIFAAIVLSFVGGISFSSAILQNMLNVSIFRLLTVIVLLAFVLVNIIWLLIKFIMQINNKDMKIFNIVKFDYFCMILIICIIIAWMLNIQDVSEFFSYKLPWCK